MSLYFIAILAPKKIDKEVSEWKQYMKEQYGCKVAQRSPAHITLIPPFNMKEEIENLMASAMNEFVSKKKI